MTIMNRVMAFVAGENLLCRYDAMCKDGLVPRLHAGEQYYMVTQRA